MKKNNDLIPLKRIVLFCFVLSWSFLSYSQIPCNRLHVIKTNNTKDLQDFFSFSPDMIPFISAHRGGADIGFPENCISTFTNTLCYVHSILEVDTRQTKDGKIVMMHDASIDRTTTGSGRVSDYTLDELNQFNLKDVNGTPTSYKIPGFDEVLDWADGKTILLIDRKSVPMEVIIDKVIEHKALHRVLFMAYNHEEAQKYHQMQPEAVMEVFVKDKDKLENLMNTGIPARNMVAFINHARPADSTLYSQINEKGMMCIIGTSRIYDHEFKKGKKRVYEDLIEEGCNIIEADLPVDAGLRIKRFRPEISSKDKFFKIVSF